MTPAAAGELASMPAAAMVLSPLQVRKFRSAVVGKTYQKFDSKFIFHTEEIQKQKSQEIQKQKSQGASLTKFVVGDGFMDLCSLQVQCCSNLRQSFFRI
jgi:hypothetical protein